jgi:hypothetical protein
MGNKEVTPKREVLSTANTGVNLHEKYHDYAVLSLYTTANFETHQQGGPIQPLVFKFVVEYAVGIVQRGDEAMSGSLESGSCLIMLIAFICYVRI